jgi:hypothetical protein
MKDTINDSEVAFARRFASVEPIDRLRMVSEMFESAKRLIAASVRSTEPDISEVELRVRIFDRLYGDDFDDATKVKLRAALRRMDRVAEFQRLNEAPLDGKKLAWGKSR